MKNTCVTIMLVILAAHFLFLLNLLYLRNHMYLPLCMAQSTSVGRSWMHTHPHGHLASNSIFFLNIIKEQPWIIIELLII